MALGYYVFLPPLPAGQHTIRFRGAVPCSGGFTQDITYTLTVGRAS